MGNLYCIADFFDPSLKNKSQETETNLKQQIASESGVTDTQAQAMGYSSVDDLVTNSKLTEILMTDFQSQLHKNTEHKLRKLNFRAY